MSATLEQVFKKSERFLCESEAVLSRVCLESVDQVARSLAKGKLTQGGRERFSHGERLVRSFYAASHHMQQLCLSEELRLQGLLSKAYAKIRHRRLFWKLEDLSVLMLGCRREDLPAVEDETRWCERAMLNKSFHEVLGTSKHEGMRVSESEQLKLLLDEDEEVEPEGQQVRIADIKKSNAFHSWASPCFATTITERPLAQGTADVHMLLAIGGFCSCFQPVLEAMICLWDPSWGAHLSQQEKDVHKDDALKFAQLVDISDLQALAALLTSAQLCTEQGIAQVKQQLGIGGNDAGPSTSAAGAAAGGAAGVAAVGTGMAALNVQDDTAAVADNSTAAAPTGTRRSTRVAKQHATKAPPPPPPSAPSQAAQPTPKKAAAVQQSAAAKQAQLVQLMRELRAVLQAEVANRAAAHAAVPPVQPVAPAPPPAQPAAAAAQPPPPPPAPLAAPPPPPASGSADAEEPKAPVGPEDYDDPFITTAAGCNAPVCSWQHVRNTLNKYTPDSVAQNLGEGAFPALASHEGAKGLLDSMGNIAVSVELCERMQGSRARPTAEAVGQELELLVMQGPLPQRVRASQRDAANMLLQQQLVQRAYRYNTRFVDEPMLCCWLLFHLFNEPE